MMRLACLAAGLALLAGCGLKGDLETPGPMWGDPGRDVVARDLPGGERRDTDQIVFTRDDVDLFREDEEERDPFADMEADAAEQGAPPPPAPDAPPQAPTP